MKYKKQIATGALALSLFVGGSSVYASYKDLGIKDVQQTYQKQNKDKEKIEYKKQQKKVGTVFSVSSNGFVIDIKNLKTKTLTPIDVKIDDSTLYKKDGLDVNFSALESGQKVIVVGDLDKTTNTLIAKKVNIITKVSFVNKHKLTNTNN